MHKSVDVLPPPQPDVRRFLRLFNRGQATASPPGVPLIELGIDPEMVWYLSGLDPADAAGADRVEITLRTLALMHRLGYDVMKVAAVIPFELRRAAAADTAALARSERIWQDQHHGTLETLDDALRYAWPQPHDVDFSSIEAAARELPDGMGLLGFCGGVLEFSMDLIGMERFMLAVYDAPDLIAEVTRRVGQLIAEVFEAYCQMPQIAALWLGDDLGSKNGLLVSPELLERHIFPWYQRYAQIAHAHGRPFLLHSCGRIEQVMPALVGEVGIDAKHSFEDAIEPVEQFMDRWGGRIAVLGGIDVGLLARGSADDVRRRVREVLSHADGRFRYALGSGNSITNYVPPENFLAMVQAGREWAQ